MQETARAAKSFSRLDALQRLGEERFDVLVIGDGITGAGVALDAAARGFHVALVDKHDFGSGTSSESSKLVHGGLRYLQQYEIGLVFQSLAERQILLRNAPHLVHPLVFVIPLFGKGGVVDKTIARTYSIGLWMYDIAGGLRIGHRHRRVSAEEVASHLPTLNLERLVAGFTYFDAQTDDARLTLAVTRTAAHDYGVAAVNHTSVVELLKGATGRLQGARVAPEDAPFEDLEVRSRIVVNATGVWADELRDLDTPLPHVLRPAKGVHIAVANSKLPCDVAVVLPSPSDGRNVFVVPWEGMTYVGTTDTEYSGSLDNPTVDAEDVSYLLEAVNAAVSQPVRPRDVVGTWCGLRPLLAGAPNRRRPPSERTADLSRRHKVLVSASGLVTITGGKLTTYRKMAQDTVDTVVEQLGGRRRRCSTKHLVLRGSRDLSSMLRPGAAAAFGVSEYVFAHLVSRYGDETPAVLEVIGERPELSEQLISHIPLLAGEVVYAARAEMATTLEDVLSRRTRVLPLDARAAISVARPVAQLVAGELGWDRARIEQEISRVTTVATSNLRMLDSLVDAPGQTSCASPQMARGALR